jgi:hypothetical protein
MPDAPEFVPNNTLEENVDLHLGQQVNLEQNNPADNPISLNNDILINMLIRQLSHMQDYNKIYSARGHSVIDPSDYGRINDPRVQRAIRETAGYFVEELYEAINKLKNKPWKQTFRETDRDEFYEEIADAWHFWLEFIILCGMDPNAIQKFYYGKAEINDQRKTEGY